jgi:hypothetical protein
MTPSKESSAALDAAISSNLFSVEARSGSEARGSRKLILFAGGIGRHQQCLEPEGWPLTLCDQRRGRDRRPSRLPYRAMSLDEIKGFPLWRLASVAHVYCWITNGLLPHAWDVRYHLTMPLAKRSGIATCNEYCLLGFFGRPMLPFIGMGTLNWLETAPVAGRHNARPDAVPAPRIDLFARQQRDGWDCWR